MSRFISCAVQINAVESENGLTPLHYACRTGVAALVKVLMANGADMNAKDLDGLTPGDHWRGKPEEWNTLLADALVALHGI